jgi:hypothetical protein
MHVRLMISGGLVYSAGVAHPLTLNTESLSTTDEAQLRQLLAEAHFWKLPPKDPAAAPPVDIRSYDLTVEESGKTQSVRLIDPVEEPHLHALLEFIKQRTGAPS